MDTVPRGATIRVEAICAPHMTVYSKAMGTEMPAAVRRHRAVGSQRPRSRVRRSFGARRQTVSSIKRAVTHSAMAVPRAAPVTPSPAPGRDSPVPGMETPGKISRLLNTTSSPHMRALSRLGVRMSPLHWSMLPHSWRICTAGRAQE